MKLTEILKAWLNSIKIKAPERDLMQSIAWKFPFRYFLYL